jgi:hypothetical protein
MDQIWTIDVAAVRRQWSRILGSSAPATSAWKRPLIHSGEWGRSCGEMLLRLL